MAIVRNVMLMLLLDIILHVVGHGSNRLSYEFYDKSCPEVERLVRETLAPMFSMDSTTPAALLRLMFHDCQVQGCDASILIDSNGSANMTSEMASSKNFGIRSRETIGALKSVVEGQCPGVVSCADLLVLAARDAVALSGGPTIRTPLGRRDALTSSYKLADALLPPATLNVDGMLRMFAAKGMDVQESVAILGAHTMGVTHCVNIMKRASSYWEGRQSNMVGSEFQLLAKLSCGNVGALAEDFFFSNDLTSSVFDNQYFRDTTSGRGLLSIDLEMTTHPRTAPFVARFALNQDEFFQVFASAFVKLSTSGVLTGKQGRILESCNGVN